MKFIATSLLTLLSCCAILLTCCAQDPYKNYTATGLKTGSPVYDDFNDYNDYGFKTLNAKLFTTFAEYSKYNFDLDYTEEYFELNNLLVFSVDCCSSDGMEFIEIMQNENALYPVFLRNKIEDGEAVTNDFIVMSFYTEVSKSSGYSLGEIIYKYR